MPLLLTPCDQLIRGPFCIVFPIRPRLKVKCLICHLEGKGVADMVIVDAMSQAVGRIVASEADIDALTFVEAAYAAVALWRISRGGG